jgi:hypothetical protein
MAETVTIGVRAEVPGERWRTGSKVGRTIYIVTPEHPEGMLVGLVDTPELAQLVVDAVNRRLAVGPAEEVPADGQ